MYVLIAEKKDGGFEVLGVSRDDVLLQNWADENVPAKDWTKGGYERLTIAPTEEVGGAAHETCNPTNRLRLEDYVSHTYERLDPHACQALAMEHLVQVLDRAADVGVLNVTVGRVDGK